MEHKDYYSILGVGRNATEGDIQNAYRERSAQRQGQGNIATAPGDEISEAYRILGNADSRRTYDEQSAAPAAEKPPKERFHFLDGLRGIASLMIVIHHSVSSNVARFIAQQLHMPFVGYLYSNFTQSGVDLFFVLSGVVLLRPYLRGQRQFKVGDYFVRRFKRIYPPYFTALILASVGSWYSYFYSPTWYNRWGGNHMGFTLEETLKELFIFNYDGIYYNLAWWSLQIEILFYVLVPVLIAIFPRKTRIKDSWIFRTICLTFIFTIAIQLTVAHFDRTGVFFHYQHNAAHQFIVYIPNIFQSLCYPVCFLMGMLLAARDFSLRQARIFIAVGIAVILLSWYYLPVIHSGYGMVYAGVIILAFNIKPFRNLLSKPIMVWLGERSYSLFLIHFTVFYLIDNLAAHVADSRNLLYAFITRGLGIPAAIFMAMLLFHFVERRTAHGLVTGKMFWPWQARKYD